MQLWHLTPCFHIPSFLADFARKRDTYDKDFLAVVMALATFTLVGIPKGWLPFEKSEIYGKVWDCIEGTQAILYTLQTFPPTLSTSMYKFSKTRVLLSDFLYTSSAVAHYLISFVFYNLDRHGAGVTHSGIVHKGAHYMRLFDPHVREDCRDSLRTCATY